MSRSRNEVTARSATGELTPLEARALDEQGFAVLERVVDDDRLGSLRSAFESACSSGSRASGRAETGTRHPADLAARGEAFARVLEHGRVLAAVEHVLKRPFRVLFFAGRDPLPGFGQQGLHTDWLPRSPGEPFAVVSALWALDDFTAENGAPRVIPGSHLVPKPLAKSMQTPTARHPAEQLVLARAGSVLVFNGHLAHSGTRNRSRGSRRALHCQWIALDRAPPQAPPPHPAAPGETEAP
jgi:ectoine hydroxylase-related dioxygenase (phytanoyl-CoA dioxygenase family)